MHLGRVAWLICPVVYAPLAQDGYKTPFRRKAFFLLDRQFKLK